MRRLTPRWTIRLRLTALYSGLFLLAGAVLLAIVYVLVSHASASSTQVVKVPGDALIITRIGSDDNVKPFPLPDPAAGPLTAIVSGGAVLGKAAIGTPSSSSVARAGGTVKGSVVAGAAPKGGFTLQSYVPFANARAKLEQAVSNERDSERSRLLAWSGIALAVMSVLSGALGWLMAGRALDPVRTMTGRARRISEQNLHERLAPDGPDDELKELGDTFDGVLDRLQGAFEAQRRFVANASHELRTPVTLARATAEVALADPDADPASLRAACETVVIASEQQERLIEGLLTLARSGHGIEQREPVDLRAVALASVDAVEPAARDRCLRIEQQLGDARTSGDSRLVERLVANLLDNAVRHNVAGGWIAVRTRLAGGRPVLEVASSGEAVDEEDVAGLLEPFRRGAAGRTARGDGHGLGLSIVAAIADAHGAELSVKALPGGGLEVAVSFAAVEDCAPALPPTPQSAASAPAAPSHRPSRGPRRPLRLRRSATSRSG